MSTDGSIRASHQDRELAAEVLRQAYVAGRLDLAELRERSGAAYSASTWGELRRITGDLPAGAAAGPPRPGRLPGQLPERTGPARHRPFTPLLMMAVSWLLIAVLAHAAQALALPLVLVALWALPARGRRPAWPAAPDARAGPGTRERLARPGGRDQPAPAEAASLPGRAGTGAGRSPASRCGSGGRARGRRPHVRLSRPGDCIGRRQNLPRLPSRPW